MPYRLERTESSKQKSNFSSLEYRVVPGNRGLEAALWAIWAWGDSEAITNYAISRHGYVGDDGHYGVSYPEDLDEYQIEVLERIIPPGGLAVWHTPSLDHDNSEDIIISERDYLDILLQYLRASGDEENEKRLVNFVENM